jgi:uncharacterized membrane protein
MAGIGFELRRAVRETTYLASIRGYLFAAIISSGPWLLSVLALSMLGVISLSFLPQESRDLFAATTTHSFAISLITVGLIQMWVTRYLADKLYIDDTEAIAPTFITVLVLSSVVQFFLMHALFARTALPLDYRMPAVSLYLAISGIWLAMIFLSAARDYVSIVLAFAVGYLISFVVAVALGSKWGPSAYLTGFAAGQTLTLALLVWRVVAEFDPKYAYATAVFAYIRRYPSLLFIGLLYNLAFWIDKIVFWFSREGINVNTFLNVFPVYDTSFFLASLTVVPALAVFLVKIETEFYDHYKAFYAAIANKRSWKEIQAAKDGMIRAVPSAYLTLFKIQGAITLLVIALTPAIMAALRIPENYWYVFRVASLAIGVQVFLLITVLLLLYLDLRGSVLIISTVFLTTNFGFTLLTLAGGYAYYGYGFLYASLASLMVALVLLDNRLRNLEYLTFTRQPLSPEE